MRIMGTVKPVVANSILGALGKANEAGSEFAEIRTQIDRLLSEVQILQTRVKAIEAAGEIEPTERPKHRILVCDDVRLLRALLRSILSAEGY